jgi:hypothetical protein
MSQRVIARIVWVVAGLSIAACLYSLWAGWQEGMLDRSLVAAVGAVVWTLMPVVFVLTGALILSRQPGNVIGLLLVMPVVSFVLVSVIFQIPQTAPAELNPALWLQLWFDNWSWVLLIFPLFHLLLVFPTGRLLSGRWRWVVWIELVMVAVMMFGAAFGEEIGPLNIEGSSAWTVPNPVGFLPITVFGTVFQTIWGAGLFFMTGAAFAAVIVRFRRSAAVERQQLKWLLFSFGMFALIYGGGALTLGEFASGSWGDLLFALSVIGIPVSIGIAILRYRLFDIDLIIRRTLLYAVLTGLLIGVYGLSVFVLQNLVGGFVGEGSPLVVAGSTLLIAALFNPLRRRLQDLIDRRLDREKYDVQRVIDEFMATARDEADMDRLSTDLLDLVGTTVRPAVSGLWIKGAVEPAD